MTKVPESPCSIARSLGVLGEKWTFLIVRDAFDGLTRFDEFRQSLGIASDVLSARLATLVEYGVLDRAEYQAQNARTRHEYVLTPAGRELLPVLAALQAWGDRHLPWADGASVLRCEKGSRRPVHVGFVDSSGHEVALEELDFVRTASYPRDRLELIEGHAQGAVS